jgi:hypothetical protein
VLSLKIHVKCSTPYLPLASSWGCAIKHGRDGDLRQKRLGDRFFRSLLFQFQYHIPLLLSRQVMASENESSNATTNTLASFATFCDVSLNEGSHVSPEQKWPALSVPSESASASDPLIERRSNTSSPQQAQITTTLPPVKWGTTRWQWSSMILTTLAGFILAILHHVYYTTLNNSVAGSSSRQQWSINIGTAFAFSVVALFKTASGTAYQQYIWRTVKRKSISIGGLDNLFALTSDPFGLFDWELWNKATLAVLLALLCW